MMAFSPSGNSDHVVVSVSIDFPSYSQRDAPFHCVVYYFSRANKDNLHNHSRDNLRENIFKLSASVAASEFSERVQIAINLYIPLIDSIRSSLTHLHGFQLLVMLS